MICWENVNKYMDEIKTRLYWLEDAIRGQQNVDSEWKRVAERFMHENKALRDELDLYKRGKK